jgi:glycosyltransferase involved in cell wall biosynthesis
VEISDYLNYNNHEGHIAYSNGIPYEKGYKIGTWFEKKNHALFSRIFGLQGYFSKAGTKNLLTYIESLNPDIIHIHNIHSNFINLKILLNFLAKNDIPTVITLHDCWFFTGKCTHYYSENCYKWQNECGKCPLLKKGNPSWFFDRTKTMHQNKKEWLTSIPRLGIIGVSDWITYDANNSFLASTAIIERIYNWVDCRIFRPVDTKKLKMKMGLNDYFIILGVASVWNKSKGLNAFLELSQLISKKTIIMLVGKISKKVNLPANILNIPETHDSKEMASLYSMADVFVNLSIEETFGKTTAEALASGTPAIVYNSTANPEVIGNQCGYVVHPNNMDELTIKINQVFNKGKETYKTACVSHAKSNFLSEHRIKDHLKFYQKVIQLK